VIGAGFAGADRDLLPLRPGLTARGDLHRPGDGEASQRHVLGPGALAIGPLISTWLQPRRLELADDVVDGLGLGRRRRLPPLEGVGRQHADVFGHARRRDRGIGGLRRRCDRKGRRDARQQMFHRDVLCNSIPDGDLSRCPRRSLPE